MHRPEDGEALLTRLTSDPPRARTKWDPRTYGIGAQILRDLGAVSYTHLDVYKRQTRRRASRRRR